MAYLSGRPVGMSQEHERILRPQPALMKWIDVIALIHIMNTHECLMENRATP